MESGFTWQSYSPEKLLIERFHISTGFYPGQCDIIEQLVEDYCLFPSQGAYEGSMSEM